MIVISACLMGVPCRYDGSGVERPDIVRALRGRDILSICPERLAGLPTPRVPCEIVNGAVLGRDGVDRTDSFRRGTSLALERLSGVDDIVALLKEKSPSCGSSMIYDGSFSGRLIKGSGLFASALMALGVSIFSEESFEDFLSYLR